MCLVPQDVLRAFSGSSAVEDVTAPIMDAVTACMEGVSVQLDDMENFAICVSFYPDLTNNFYISLFFF